VWREAAGTVRLDGKGDAVGDRDWGAAFDHFDPAYAAAPFEIWDELRTGCPVAVSPRFRGMVVPTRHADIEAVARDTGTWSSRSPLVADFGSVADFGLVVPPISAPPSPSTATPSSTASAPVGATVPRTTRSTSPST